MKKYILGTAFSLALLVSPVYTQAAGLTSSQVQSILLLLSSFGADQSVINNVKISLSGGTSPSGAGTTSSQTMSSNASLTITTATPLPTATVGTPYSLTFASTGGTGTLLWNLNPYNTRADIGGLEWSNVDDISRRPNGLGVIRGTPTIVGTYRFTITVNNSASKEFTLVVNPSSGANGTCTGWTYSAWGTCQSNGTQTRTYSSSSATPAGCTGGSPTVSQICSYTPTVVTPPVTISCTGTPPPTGNGVAVHDYTTVSVGGGAITSANTVWQYGASSCGWGCAAPMLRNGDIGCKNPEAGTGATITLNNLSNGSKFSGVALAPQTIIGLSGFAATGLGGTNGVFTTGSNGKTPEFWLSSYDIATEWTTVGVPMFDYKIRSATGCVPDVSIHANKTNNRCTGIKNGIPVTINMVPGDISTIPTTVFPKSSFVAGESLTGIIVGGDPKNTWGCMDSPNTIAGHECMSGWSGAWRQLTAPYGGQADGWHLVETNYGDTIQLSPLPTAGYPAGIYTQYVKTGQYGTVKTPTSFTLTAAQGTAACTSLTYSAWGTCSANGTQTRTFLSATPTGCSILGSQTLTQNCTVTSSVSAPYLASLSRVSGLPGDTVTINGSGFTGSSGIYIDGVLVDPATQGSSGGPTPAWISFVVPVYLHGCPSYMRPPFCTNSSPLVSGTTHSISVQDTNGTSNSLSFAVAWGLH